MARTRAKKMDTYWYLTSRDGIGIYTNHVAELGTPDDDSRFASGNYFTDPKEADRMIARVRGFIKKVSA